VDSNPAKTLGSKLDYGSGVVGSVYGGVNRPQWDVGDIATGVENSGTGLYNRVPASGVFDWYVGALPNNPGGTSNNWTEELSVSGHTFNEPVTVNGNLTVTGVCTGCGGGGSGSGTVNSGTASQVAVYPGNGAAVSGDSALSDSGTTLNYAGTGGISAAAGTFSGNVTVNGQLMVAGPWMVDSPVPGSAMGAAPSGTSSLGISNDGNFYISANAGTPLKVATTGTSSYFSNLFQEDANDLGEYVVGGTTANPQAFHVYSSYTNSSTWQRTSLGYDGTDNLAVLRSENSSSGSAPGLGFWIGSSVRWAIDSTSTLKPFLNNSINIGSTTLAPQTIYAATSLDTLTQGRENFELCNDGTTGTSLNFLAVYNGATPACAVKAGTSATDGVIGVVSNGSGTTLNAVITYRGYVPCSFDGATTAGDFVVASTTNAGDCHDAGATRPTGVQVIGRVESTNGTLGTYGVRASLDAPNNSTASPVTSAFGRSGAVTAASGDYSVGQVTGAAALASPALTGTPTAPTATAGNNSTQLATTAYVKSEIQLVFSCPIGGTTTASVSYCNWTAPAGITITQFDLFASTAPSGCTTFPVVQVWDGTAAAEVGSYSITMSTSQETLVTGSTTFTSGHGLRLRVTTAAAGCTTGAANVTAAVTYQMTN
jgi:hypothetical protein